MEDVPITAHSEEIEEKMAAELSEEGKVSEVKKQKPVILYM
jgi:hypothetical protein